MLAVIVAIATAAAVAAVWRLWWILPGRPGAPAPLQMNGSAKPGAALAPVRTIIVLGSGGHTTEMFALMAKLDRRRYLPRMYIVASTDSMGTSKVEDFESKGGSGSKPGHSVHIIPRSREVKQPWITTVWTTLLALVSSILLIARLQPDVVLCNGPGTCVPICVAAYLLRYLGVRPVTIVYIESFARVKHLSLSGKLLYAFADIFLVQWADLLENYPRAKYLGVLV